jgi:hypothetical protein
VRIHNTIRYTSVLDRKCRVRIRLILNTAWYGIIRIKKDNRTQVIKILVLGSEPRCLTIVVRLTLVKMY